MTRENCTLVPTDNLREMQVEIAELRASKPEAASLRMRVKELEAWHDLDQKQIAYLIEERNEALNQLTERDQQVAEACAEVCETPGIGAKYQGDVYSEAIRSGEWKKHIKKGVE
jgi:hypothetical protein